MDSTLAALTSCEKLSLSTNMITGVSNLHNMKNLKILSLGRNLIKNLAGIEVVGDTLQQLWISYNKIEKLAPMAKLVNLKTLYMAHNNVKYKTDSFVKTFLLIYSFVHSFDNRLETGISWRTSRSFRS